MLAVSIVFVVNGFLNWQLFPQHLGLLSLLVHLLSVNSTLALPTSTLRCAHVAFNLSTIIIHLRDEASRARDCRVISATAIEELRIEIGLGQGLDAPKYWIRKFENEGHPIPWAYADICSYTNRYCLGKKWFGTLEPFVLRTKCPLEGSPCESFNSDQIRDTCACKFRLELLLFRLWQAGEDPYSLLRGVPREHAGPYVGQCTLNSICNQLSKRYPALKSSLFTDWQCDNRKHHMKIESKLSCRRRADILKTIRPDSDERVRCQCNFYGTRDCQLMLNMLFEDQHYIQATVASFVDSVAFFPVGENAQLSAGTEMAATNPWLQSTGEHAGEIQNLDALEQVSLPVRVAEKMTKASPLRAQQVRHLDSLSDLSNAGQASSSKRARLSGSDLNDANPGCERDRSSSHAGYARQRHHQEQPTMSTFYHSTLNIAADEHYLFEDDMIDLVNRIVEGSSHTEHDLRVDQRVFSEFYPEDQQLRVDMAMINNLDDVEPAQVAKQQQLIGRSTAGYAAKRHAQPIPELSRVRVLNEYSVEANSDHIQMATDGISWTEFFSEHDPTCESPGIEDFGNQDLDPNDLANDPEIQDWIHSFL